MRRSRAWSYLVVLVLVSAGLVVSWTALPQPAAAEELAVGTSEREAEASDNVLSGGAIAWSCATCSGGQKVGNIGFAGQLLLPAVQAPWSLTYTVTFSYASGEGRWGYISVDGATPVSVWFPSTGSFDSVSTVTYRVYLSAGTRTLAISNPTGWAPDFDRISTHDYDAEAGELIGGAVVAGCWDCSGRMKVGWVGYSGRVDIPVVVADEGNYVVTVHYTSGENRSAYVRGAQPSDLVSFPSTGGWQTVGVVQLIRPFLAGANTIQISNPNGWAPDFDKVSVSDVEAEAPSNALVGGGGRIYCPNCSGKSKVGWLGFGARLEIRDVVAPASALYPLVFYYLSAEQRTAYISVNSGPSIAVTFPAMPSWDTVGLQVVALPLDGGPNSIVIFNPDGWVADIDRLVASLTKRRPSSDEMCATEKNFHAGHGRLDLSLDEMANGVSFQGVRAEVPIRDAFLCKSPGGESFSTVSTLVANSDKTGYVQAGYDWVETPFQPKVLCRYTEVNKDLTSPQRSGECPWSAGMGSVHLLWVSYLSDPSPRVFEMCVDERCRYTTWDPADPSDGWGRSPLRTWRPQAFGETWYLESDIPGTHSDTVRFTGLQFQLSSGSWTTEFGDTETLRSKSSWQVTPLGREKDYSSPCPSGYDSKCFHIWVTNPRV